MYYLNVNVHNTHWFPQLGLVSLQQAIVNNDLPKHLHLTYSRKPRSVKYHLCVCVCVWVICVQYMHVCAILCSALPWRLLLKSMHTCLLSTTREPWILPMCGENSPDRFPRMLRGNCVLRTLQEERQQPPDAVWDDENSAGSATVKMTPYRFIIAEVEGRSFLDLRRVYDCYWSPLTQTLTFIRTCLLFVDIFPWVMWKGHVFTRLKVVRVVL